MATNLDVLLAGRVVQGVAGALLIPTALPILIHAFPNPIEKAKVIGGWSAFTAVALILGPLLGGILLELAGWQSIFIINIPLGALALGLGIWGIIERKNPEQAALDPFGQLLSIIWLGALTYGLIEAGHHGFSGILPLVSFSIAFIGFVLFSIVECRVERPLLPLKLFKDPLFASTNYASFILGFSVFSSLFFFALFLQNIQGWSPAEAGVRMIPQFLLTIIVSLLFGRLNSRISLSKLTTIGFAIGGVAMLLMVLFTPNTSYWFVGATFALLGVGMGTAVPGSGLMVINTVPKERSGMASSTMNALKQIGMTMGIALLGTLMSIRATQHLAQTILSANGVSDISPLSDSAYELAHQTITQHAIAEGDTIMTTAYAHSMISGFHLAMLVAGAACISVALLLTCNITKLERTEQTTSV